MSLQNLRVLRAAEQLDAIVLPLIKDLPPEFASDVDEIVRALGSITYNIGEAYGQETAGRTAYHLSIARGSSDEVRTGLRRLVRRGALTMLQTYKPSALASTIAKMLTAWINTIRK